MINLIPSFEKGVPFQFTQKSLSRSSESGVYKRFSAISVLFLQALERKKNKNNNKKKKTTKKKKKKQAPKMPDFNTNQNFAFNIASSIEGLSTEIRFSYHFEFEEFIQCTSMVMLFTLIELCKNHNIIKLSVYV